MSVTTLKNENGNVSFETPDGTMINININQRSALDCLLDTIRALKATKKSDTDTKPTSGTAPAERLGVGVSLISLGCISVMLAVILCVVQPNLNIFFSGTHFWVGFPFIVAGALNIVSYKYPKPLWKTLAFICLLGSIGVSIAGMVLAINDLSRVWWASNFGYVCDNLRNGRGSSYDGYGRTAPPNTDYYSRDWDLANCKEMLKKYQNILFGLVMMTLLMMICGLFISIISLGCRLKAICCGCTNEYASEEKDDPLLIKKPTGELLIV